MKIKVRVELLIDVDYIQNCDSENELFEMVGQELTDMLYVGTEPDPGDLMQVTDFHMRFMKVEHDGDLPVPE